MAGQTGMKGGFRKMEKRHWLFLTPLAVGLLLMLGLLAGGG